MFAISIRSSLIIKTIVKALPQNVCRHKTFRSAHFFRNEAYFYNQVLPELINFQEKRGIFGTPSAFFEHSKCLATYIDGANDFIVLEDLCPDGFTSAPRQDGMDFDGSRLIMQTLGKFHAVSLAIGDQEPEVLDKIIGGLEVRSENNFFKSLKPC